jgi:hypothetical protein
MLSVKEAASAFLANKRIAVTGVSRTDNGHGSNHVYRRLRQRGYEVFAVRSRSCTGPTTSASLTSLNSAELRSPFAWYSRRPRWVRWAAPRSTGARHDVAEYRHRSTRFGAVLGSGTGSTTAMRADGRTPGLPEPLGGHMTRRQQVAAANHASRKRSEHGDDQRRNTPSPNRATPGLVLRT